MSASPLPDGAAGGCVSLTFSSGSGLDLVIAAAGGFSRSSLEGSVEQAHSANIKLLRSAACSVWCLLCGSFFIGSLLLGLWSDDRPAGNDLFNLLDVVIRLRDSALDLLRLFDGIEDLVGGLGDDLLRRLRLISEIEAPFRVKTGANAHCQALDGGDNFNSKPIHSVTSLIASCPVFGSFIADFSPNQKPRIMAFMWPTAVI